MASIIEVKGLKHECLIKGRTLEEQRSVATSIGYTHLYGDVKYKKDIVEKVQNKFKELFPFYYNNIEISLNLNL